MVDQSLIYFLILLAIVVAVDISFLNHYFKKIMRCMRAMLDKE